MTTPSYVPGTRAAIDWLKGLAGDVLNEERWDFSRKNLSAVEHVSHLSLLLGRARSVVPNLHSLNLCKTQLTLEGLATLSGSLPKSNVQILKCAATK